MLNAIHRQNHSITLEKNGKPVATYRYGAVPFHPFCHPIVLENGAVMTDSMPGDHPWHNGAFYAWKYLNGCNVWDQQSYEGHSRGYCQDLGARIISLEENAATLENKVQWQDSNRAPLLDDTILVTIKTDPSNGSRILDWTQKTICVANEVVAEREDKWGGYGGFMVRLPRMNGQEILNNLGEQNWPESHKPRCQWVDYTWNVDGLPSGTWHEHFAGVTVMSHPSNPGAPLPFHLYHESYSKGIHPAVLQDAALRFKKGDRMEQRYRVWFHSGKTDANSINAIYADWLK